MVTPELMQYVKTQQQNGQTIDIIKSNLIAKGWQEDDLDSAFERITLNSLPTASSSNIPHSNPAAKGFPLTLVALLVTGLVLAGGGIIAFNSFRKNASSPEKNLTAISTSPSPTSTPSPTFTPPVSPTITQKNAEENILYSSPEQGYGFRYLKSWKIDKQGTLTVLVDPSSPDAQQCAALLEKILACDIMVSSVPYYEAPSAGTGVTAIEQPPVKSHNDQVKDIAAQMTVGTVTPITLLNLSGYEASTTNSDGSTYNVLLQGSKNMILVQFPNKKIKTDLNQEQLAVLNSISEP